MELRLCQRPMAAQLSASFGLRDDSCRCASFAQILGQSLQELGKRLGGLGEKLERCRRHPKSRSALDTGVFIGTSQNLLSIRSRFAAWASMTAQSLTDGAGERTGLESF